MMRTRILFLLARVTGVAVALVTTPIIARLLGLEGMAQLVVLTSWAAVAAAIADAGGVIRVQQDARHGTDPRAVFGDMWLLRLVLLGVLALIGLALVPVVGPAPVAVVLLVAFGQSVSGLVIGILPSTRFSSRVGLVDLGVRAGAGVLAIVVAATTRSGAATALAAAAPALLAVAALPAGWWRVAPRGWLTRIAPRRQVQLALIPVTSAILLRSDVLLLGLLGAPAEEVGAFATLSRLTEFILMLAVGLLGFMLPDLHASSRPAATGQRWLGLALAACVGLAAATSASRLIAWVLGGASLVDYVSPESGVPAPQLLAPMFLALGLRLVSDVLVGYLLWQHRARVALLVLLVNLALRVVVAWATVPQLGYVGTAVSGVVAEVGSLAIAVVATRRTGIWDRVTSPLSIAVAVLVLCLLVLFGLELPTAGVVGLGLMSLVVLFAVARWGAALWRTTGKVEGPHV